MRILVLLAVIVVWPLSGFAADPPAKEPAVIRPVLWWAGLHPHTDVGGGGGGQDVQLITRARDHTRVWKLLEPKAQVPEVNLKDYFVLVVHRPGGLTFLFGGLALDDQGEAKIGGIDEHPDNMNSRIYSSTIAVFPRRGIKTVEGKPLPAVE
jgi:hypothetical protein